MVVIPALDLRGGKCVRLAQGREEEATEYTATPVELAQEWWRQGARLLHVVNLDGAFGRVSGNLDVLRTITSAVPLRIQYGGGLRSLESMDEAVSAGAGKIILGTVAVEDPSLFQQVIRRFGPDRVIVALDALNGLVVTNGWKVISDIPIGELAESMLNSGVQEVLYTDVARDGMMGGPDLVTLVRLASTGLRVIASGGVASVDDIRAILALKEPGISGVVVGKALLDGRVEFRTLLEVSEEASGKD